jgi:hypothetical protein
MRGAGLRAAVGFSTLFALVVAGRAGPPGREAAARETSARRAALAYARAHNAARAKTKGAADDLRKLAAFPFFSGRVDGLLRGGPPSWKAPVVFKDGEGLRSHFDRWQGVLGPGPLGEKVGRVERYADYRKKYLEAEPDGKAGFRTTFLRALREGCDAAVGPGGGLLVSLVDKSGATAAVLIRFEGGRAKVVGTLYEPFAEAGGFGAPKRQSAPAR